MVINRPYPALWSAGSFNMAERSIIDIAIVVFCLCFLGSESLLHIHKSICSYG